MTMAISVRSLPIVLEPPYRRVGDIDPDSGRDGDRLPVDEDVQVGVDVVYSCGSGVRPAGPARSIGGEPARDSVSVRAPTDGLGVAVESDWREHPRSATGP